MCALHCAGAEVNVCFMFVCVHCAASLHSYNILRHVLIIVKEFRKEL